MKPSRGRFVRLLAALAAVDAYLWRVGFTCGRRNGGYDYRRERCRKNLRRTPAEASGTPVAKDGDTTVTISSGLCLYLLQHDGGGYSSATPPTNAGDYKLVVSVSNGTYADKALIFRLQLQKLPSRCFRR
jgi:hypothetical protein